MKKTSYAFLILAIIWMTCTSADTEAPVVNITGPVHGSIVSSTVNIAISAADNEAVDRIELYVDGTVAQVLTAQPYIHSWITDSLLNDSSHDLIAKAYDAEENEGISPLVTVTVFNDTTGPSFFIWDYDEFDVFYDPAIGATVDCSYWIEQTLVTSGHTYTKSTSLPANLDTYDIVFVTLGWFRC